LSYDRDHVKKHSGFSLPSTKDFEINLPIFEYENKLWSYENIYDAVKRDVKSYALANTGDILSQVYSKTTILRSRSSLHRQPRRPQTQNELARERTVSSASQASRLRYVVEPPTPLEEESETFPSLARSSTGGSSGGSLARILSRSASGRSGGNGSPQKSTSLRELTPDESFESNGSIDESLESGDTGRYDYSIDSPDQSGHNGRSAPSLPEAGENGHDKVGKAVRGILSKLKITPRRHDSNESAGSNHSSTSSPEWRGAGRRQSSLSSTSSSPRQ